MVQGTDVGLHHSGLLFPRVWYRANKQLLLHGDTSQNWTVCDGENRQWRSRFRRVCCTLAAVRAVKWTVPVMDIVALGSWYVKWWIGGHHREINVVESPGLDQCMCGGTEQRQWVRLPRLCGPTWLLAELGRPILFFGLLPYRDFWKGSRMYR